MKSKAIAIFLFAVMLVHAHAAASGLSPALRAYYQKLRKEIPEG